MLTVMDESTSERLAIVVSTRLTGDDRLERLADLCVRRGVPEHVRGKPPDELLDGDAFDTPLEAKVLMER